MNILREKQKCAGLHGVLMGGDGGDSTSKTETINTDNRTAVQDGVALAGSSNNSVNYNSTDAVKAVAQLGTDAIARTGAAVVELNQTSVAANATAWDKTVTQGAALVDKLIDASTTLGSQAISSYQPADKTDSDNAVKLGMVAAAAIAATLLLRKA